MVSKHKQTRFLVLLVLIVMLPFVVFSHDMRPASLQIKQVGDSTYTVLWKVPRNQNQILSITPKFPIWFNYKNMPNAYESGSGMVLKQTVFTSHTIYGMPVQIQGIEKSNADVLVQVEWLNGMYHSFILSSTTPIGTIPQMQTRTSILLQYFQLGIKHILLGFDHLLFVMALYMLSRGKKQLLLTITSFTIAHSITLSLAALGHISLAVPPVEAIIALSILFLVREILRQPSPQNSFSKNYPWAIAFVFGLLHGLGFAGALSETGLPQLHLPIALISFNVGVEFGQLVFISILICLSILNTKLIQLPPLINRIISYSMGMVAGFWFVERIFIFFQ
jgi:hydrogenase/urease accessory protein HupE